MIDVRHPCDSCILTGIDSSGELTLPVFRTDDTTMSLTDVIASLLESSVAHQIHESFLLSELDSTCFTVEDVDNHSISEVVAVRISADDLIKLPMDSNRIYTCVSYRSSTALLKDGDCGVLTLRYIKEHNLDTMPDEKMQPIADDSPGHEVFDDIFEGPRIQDLVDDIFKLMEGCAIQLNLYRTSALQHDDLAIEDILNTLFGLPPPTLAVLKSTGVGHAVSHEFY